MHTTLPEWMDCVTGDGPRSAQVKVQEGGRGLLAIRLPFEVPVAHPCFGAILDKIARVTFVEFSRIHVLYIVLVLYTSTTCLFPFVGSLRVES